MRAETWRYPRNRRVVPSPFLKAKKYEFHDIVNFPSSIFEPPQLSYTGFHRNRQ